MILDDLKNLKPFRAVSTRLGVALDFLFSTDLHAISLGEHALQSDVVFARVMEYQTKPVAQCPWESHRKYIDVQYMVKGAEVIGYAPLKTMRLTAEYDPAKDFQAMDGEGDYFTLGEGMVAVLWPHDAHRPSIEVGSPGKVRKIVVKVGVD